MDTRVKTFCPGMDSIFLHQTNSHETLLSFNSQFHRYTGRGLFLDPPSVSMQNNAWNISIPKGFQLENLKLENLSKFKFPTLFRFLVTVWNIIILIC